MKATDIPAPVIGELKATDIPAPVVSKWSLGDEVEKWAIVATDLFAMILALNTMKWILGLTDRHIQYLDSAVQIGRISTLTHVSLYFFLSGVLVLVFWAKGHYSKRLPFWTEARFIIKFTLTLALVHASLMLFGKLPYSRAALLLNWALAPIFLIAGRDIIKRVLTALGGWTRPMVIIGWGENSIETARAFEDEPRMGYRLQAFLVPTGRKMPAVSYTDCSGNELGFSSLGSDPLATLARLGNPHVVIALEPSSVDVYQKMVQQLSRTYHDLQVVPSLRGLPLYGMEVSHFFSHEVLLLSVRNNLARRASRIIKRCFDVVVSLALLIAGSPILLIIGLCVAGSRGPIFYGHTRVGQNGRSFSCYKFRTMLPDAAQLLQELLDKDPDARAEWDRDFKLKNDPRITKIGHFLRKTSLDELPQLWNVLKGEMSLVGPRPVVDAELERYGDQVNYYLQAKPGITGLWQISGRNDITYDSRVYLDSWYVKNWSFFNDIVIMLRTVKVIFKRDGAY